jgi:pimeloyl-ACP methyl ester carboxylesterase
MNPTEGYVRVADGVRVFFQTVGSGAKALFLLNGFYLVEDFKYLSQGRTIVGVDLRHRGRSDYVAEPSRLERGVLNDVDDIEAVRKHFGFDSIDLLGHSYAGKTVILYAMNHPTRVGRIIQIGPVQPDQNKQYPPPLNGADATLQEFFTRFAELQHEASSADPQEYCRKVWSILRAIYVANPADADKLKWDNCHLPTERDAMRYWMQYLQPSLVKATLTPVDLAKVKAAVFTIHGRKDRSSPYGSARDWAAMLPNARLLTVEDAAHVPWIEAPEKVLEPIKVFLDGEWPVT